MSNSVISSFKETGKEILSKPHSLIRGLSNSVGITGAIYTMDQMGVLAKDSGFLYLLGVVGGVTYMTHSKKEEKNALLSEAYPEKKLKNFYNKASEYVMTGVSFAGGVLGMGAAAMAQMTSGTASIFGLNGHHVMATTVTAFVLSALPVVVSSAKDFFFGDNDMELAEAKRRIAVNKRRNTL